MYRRTNVQYIIIDAMAPPDVVDKEVMLVHVDLNTRCTAVEFQESLGAMLTTLRSGYKNDLDGLETTNMHGLRITLSITSIEKVKHFFFEFFAIFFNDFARLETNRSEIWEKARQTQRTFSAIGRSTSFATMFNRLNITATCRRPDRPSFLMVSKCDVSPLLIWL